LALAHCVYRAVASEKPISKKLFAYNNGLLSPGCRNLLENLSAIYFLSSTLRLKPAATAASQSRGLIGRGIGTDIGPGTDPHQLVPLRQVDVIPAQIAGL
jgi:hypothetical protein